MKFQHYQPCARLAPYVKHYIVSENAEAQVYKVLPGTVPVIGFQYTGRLAYKQNGADIELSTAGITGLLDAYREFKNTADTGTVLVVFTETGAAHFLKQPLHELFGQSNSLDHFFNRAQLAETEEKLALAHTDQHRVRIVEQLLIDQLLDIAEDLLVRHAISHIVQARGNVRIADLARNLNISQSPLEKRFRRMVGASPKKYSSIVRIKHVMAAMQNSSHRDAGYLAGYHDQAHLIKDFKTFTGVTPDRYLRSLRKIQ